MGLFRKSDSAWKKVEGLSPGDKVPNRDVFEDQQIERSEIGEKQTMATRMVFVWFIAILAAVLVWLFISVAGFLVSTFQGTLTSSSTILAVASTVMSDGSAAASVPDGFAETSFDDGGEAAEPSWPPTRQGVDAGGNSGPSSDGYASTRGMTYEQFRDYYFYQYQAPGSWIALWYNRATGAQAPESDIHALYNQICGSAGGQEAYRTLYGRDAVMDGAGNQGGTAAPPGPAEQETAGPVSPSEAVPGMATDPAGNRDGRQSQPNQGGQGQVPARRGPTTFGGFVAQVTFGKLMWSLFFGAIAWLAAYFFMKKNLEAQNTLNDVVEINQYKNDQHIALPEETQREFDWFPDVGAHSPVQVSSMISHVALQNKGLKQVQVARRAEKDMVDKDGNVVYLKGEVLLDEDGQPIMDTYPMIDEKFSEALFDASKVLKNQGTSPFAFLIGKTPRIFRKRYDTTAIPYNKDNENRGKLKDAEMVSDMINKYWTFPQYEPQRPSGAYIVDTEPVNTMV